MRTRRVLRSAIVNLLAVALLMVWMPVAPAVAGMVPTHEAIDAIAAEQTRDRVLQFLGREDVRRQMEALGVEPDEAAARVGGLSDSEIEQIAGQLDELPAGESAATIIGVFLAIVLVLLLTDLFGWTDVYSFVDPVE